MSKLVTVYHLDTAELWELQDVVARQLVCEGSFGYSPPKPKAPAVVPAPKAAPAPKAIVHADAAPGERT